VRAILLPVGSAGDVHPLMGLGLALQERGHEVVLATNPYFADTARRAGLRFVPLGDDDFQKTLNDPNLWHPFRGFRAVMHMGVLPLLEPMFELIRELYVPGNTVVAAGTLAFAARVAQQALGVPVASIHLQPAIFRSVGDTPKLPGMIRGRFTPRWLTAAQYWLVDKLFVDRVVRGPINDLCAKHGAPPANRILDRWVHSPQCVLGMFPEWYAAPQPDWPPNVQLPGFPLYDERGVTEPPADLVEFLAEGDAPIAFTPGSANVHGAAFFQTAIDACRLLKRRGLLLTRFPDQVPQPLPAEVRHVSFAPFSWLLPRVAALVHHGGIGTLSQALQAGIPQLVMPLSHDQPDNAMRLRKLGVGDSISPARFQSAAVAAQLYRLLALPEVATACRDVARRFEGARGIESACDALEKLRGADRPPISTIRARRAGANA
jgi:UDP:flavonoid glycosyltransferase YjiC (YdhE family)